MAEATEGLVYRGHPLRRVDNLIYYGSMADKYIVMMQVLDTTPLKDITLAKRVSIQLQMTDASLRFARPCGSLDGKRKPWRGDGICLHLA